MNVAAWWPLLLVAWFAAGVVVGLLLGRAIRRRDQVPAHKSNEEG